MMSKYKRLLCAALLTIPCAMSLADDRPYTEGNVVVVTWISHQARMFDEYMKWVSTVRKQEMEEFKKSGVIVSYGIFQAQAHSPNDADIILTITYKNFAALDGLTERSDAIDKKIFGSVESANKASISREQMREVLGSETIQQLVLK